jgi:hypothetical protein
MDSRHFSAATKRLAWKRCAGHCEKCTTKLTTGNIIYDHVIPWEISHDSSLGNCQILCRKSCDFKKTYQKDLPEIAYVHRVFDGAIGIKRSGKKLPAGRNSGIRKKLNGEVVRRPERGEEHRELMKKLHGEQAT